MSPRLAAPLLVAALLCAATAAARGATIKVTANTCADIATAFTKLSDAYTNATTNAKITLQLTFNCTGTFECTSSNQLGSFAASAATTRNGKQPPVKIDITAGSRCRKGDTRPLIIGTAPVVEEEYVFTIDKGSYPETRVDVSISSLRVVGFPAGYLVSMFAWPGTRSTFAVKDVDVNQAGIYAGNVDTASVTGSSSSNVSYLAVWMAAVEKSVTIKDNAYNNNGFANETDPGSVGLYNMGAKAKVSISGNTFQDNGAASGGKAIFLEFNGDVSASLTRNTFANNTFGTAPYVVCLNNIGNSTRRPSVSIAGSKGLDPAKPGPDRNEPWPTDAECNVAAFTQT